jgi:hypothetical protein
VRTVRTTQGWGSGSAVRAAGLRTGVTANVSPSCVNGSNIWTTCHSKSGCGRAAATLLTPLRVALLEIGFVWCGDEHQWDKMFGLLCKYVTPKCHLERTPRLGSLAWARG